MIEDRANPAAELRGVCIYSFASKNDGKLKKNLKMCRKGAYNMNVACRLL